VTDEELDRLTRDISKDIEQLVDDPEKPLNRKERRRKIVLRARRQALDKIKEARQKGNMNQEVKASLEYTLLTEYAEKNILLYNLMKARLYLWRAF
jgi:hypothetical protein